jgi:hypothetical protein
VPLFKAETDIGQLSEIMQSLGSPDEALYQRILNPTGQNGLGFSFKQTDPKPMGELLPKAEEDALDLLRYSNLTKNKMQKAEEDALDLLR